MEATTISPPSKSGKRPARVPEDTVTCPRCQAIHPRDAVACAECGADLVEADPVRRHVTNTELKRAYAWIDAVAWLYRLGALTYALATLFAVLALGRTDVPVREGVLVVVLTTLLAVLMLQGALHLRFKPLIWTGAIAALATAVSVVHWFGPNPYGVAFLGSAAWAVAAWAALVPTLKFHRLTSLHRDRYVLHHASARTRRSLLGRTPEERHERLVRAMQRAARRAWRTSAVAGGALLVLGAGGTWAVLTTARPQVLSDVLARFERAWNEDDLVAVGSFYGGADRAAQTARLDGWMRAHGWGDGWPAVAGGERREGGDRTFVEYAAGGRTLTTSWYRNGRSWRLIEVALPVPDFAPALRAFRAAWRDADAAAVAAFFSEETRDAMRASLAEAAEGRGWRSFPDLLEDVRDDPSDGETRVVFTLADGTLRTWWHIRADGTWGLHRLELPRR